MDNYKDMCDTTTHTIAKNIENKLQSIEYDKSNESYYWKLIAITGIPTLKESTSKFAHLNAKAEIY